MYEPSERVYFTKSGVGMHTYAHTRMVVEQSSTALTGLTVSAGDDQAEDKQITQHADAFSFNDDRCFRDIIPVSQAGK